MILHMQIRDFVVVEKADITFHDGMTVITGETGSGKSLLLSALELLLGGKADAQSIRPGAEEVILQATFELEALPEARAWLAAEGFSDAPQIEIIRKLPKSLRARATLNGKSISRQQLKCLANHLCQIHGQHQHQSLLMSHEQRRLVDAFADNHVALEKTRQAYKAWLTLVEKRESLLACASDNGQTALLKYQVAELDTLELTKSLWETLNKDHHLLSNAEQLLSACDQGTAYLSGTEPTSLLETLQKTLLAVQPLENAELNQLLGDARIQLEEADRTLQGLVQDISLDPEQLASVEKRLSALYDIARKHHIEPESLFDYAEGLKQTLEESINRESILETVDADITQALGHYQQTAHALTETRQKASKKLAKEVEGRIASLGLPNSCFKILLTPTESPSPMGAETICFQVSTNPEQPCLPLARVASGGELSRISLAIQAINAHALQTPTLFFDEVDVGISGKTGAIVGRALRDLGKHGQVICITHLPQVAALAGQHIAVQKSVKGKQTTVAIEALSLAQRVEELARMLGGLDVTPQARAHAKALMEE